MATLTGHQIADADLDGWVNLLGGLQTRIRTPDFAAGLALLVAIGAAAQEMDHHPDLDLRYAHLDVRLRSHDVGGVTDRDIRLARAIGRLAAQAGLRADADGVAMLEYGLDTPDSGQLAPFWAAVLGMEHVSGSNGDNEVRDPAGALPTVWFQNSGVDEPRQRWHPDLWVDPAEVQSRIDAAVAAGGRLVSDEEAPSFWVLADPEGNRMCLCTWQDRG